MKLSAFVEFVVGVVFLGGGYLATHLEGWPGKLVGAAALVVVCWWMKYGLDLKGWVGPSYRELCEEEQRLHALLREWEAKRPTVATKDIERIRKQLDKVWHMQSQHPDRPNASR